MSSSALYRATENVAEEELRWMVLDQRELPGQFADFRLLREGPLDNAAMAEQGMSERTAEDLRAIGRITGHLREFVSAASPELLTPGVDLAVATVVHLFEDGQGVSRWMAEVFLKEFEEVVGRDMAPGYSIASARRFSPVGLADESAGLNVVQAGTAGEASSTIIDFQLGRLLGVAYLVTAGEAQRNAEVEALARDLEKKMVRIVLGAA